MQLGLPLHATNYLDAAIWNLTGSQYNQQEFLEGVNKTVQVKIIWS